jgi:hypothetical protein
MAPGFPQIFKFAVFGFGIKKQGPSTLSTESMSESGTTSAKDFVLFVLEPTVSKLPSKFRQAVSLN